MDTTLDWALYFNHFFQLFYLLFHIGKIKTLKTSKVLLYSLEDFEDCTPEPEDKKNGAEILSVTFNYISAKLFGQNGSDAL